MQRVGENSAVGPLSTILPQVHHGRALSDMAHHRQIVRDEQISYAKALCRSTMRLIICACTLDVKGGDGFIGHDRRGVRARARAMPMCCRCPPLNSCG